MPNPIFDPQSLPIDTIAGEPALDSSRLNLSWLRERFQHPPTWQPEVSTEHSLFPPDKRYTNASVLIAIVEREQGLHVLLTQRTDHLEQHPGQISFPGGQADREDQSVVDTALREAQEEIGLNKEHVEILGTLPNYFTITGYRVTPVVAAITSSPILESNTDEVAEIFEVPLSFLMDGNKHQRRSYLFQNPPVRRTFYTMPYQHYFIWGATAGMLRNLFHFLRA